MNRVASRWCVIAVVPLVAGCSSTTPQGPGPDSGAGDATFDSAVADAGVDAIEEGGAGSDAGGPEATGGGADASCAASTSDAGLTTYGPDNPAIRYTGRVDFADPTHPKFAASAVYVTTKFEGSAVKVNFSDQNLNGGFNFFDVTVDDFPALKIVPKVGVSSYDATPAGLCRGVHSVTVVKRTEADVGFTTFLGFGFDGPIMPPDPVGDGGTARRIEIIGDSITCGAGIEATSTTASECSSNGLSNLIGMPISGYGQGVENGRLAYGPVLARALGAEWHVTCAGGIGLVRNYYSRGDQRTMPTIYPFLYPEDTSSTTLWDPMHDQWVPDVIVIGLGTNDFSRDSGDPSNPRPPMPVVGIDGGVGLVDGYIAFIDRLASYYPGVRVVLVSSPILGDMYPTPSDMQLSDHRQAIADVVAYFGPDGGAAPVDGGRPSVQVYAALVDKVSGTGCGGHPGIAQQAAAANQIGSVIKAAMGW